MIPRVGYIGGIPRIWSASPTSMKGACESVGDDRYSAEKSWSQRQQLTPNGGEFAKCVMYIRPKLDRKSVV